MMNLECRDVTISLKFTKSKTNCINTSLKYLGAAVRKTNCENKVPKWKITRAQNGTDNIMDLIGGQRFYSKYLELID